MYHINNQDLCQSLMRFAISGMFTSALSSATLASYDIKVPASGSMPAYFSGTNARISAAAIPPIEIPTDNTPAILPPPNPPNPLIVEAWLYIGGQLTYHYDWASLPTPRPAPYPAMTVNVMFDSTHFADGTNLQIEFRVKDQNGSIYSNTGAAVVINKAVLYGRHDFEVGGDPEQMGFSTVSQACSGMNIQVRESKNERGWKATEFYNSIEGPTSVVYLHTHGWSDMYVLNPPLPSPWNPDTYMLSDLDELPAVDPDTEYYIYPTQAVRFNPYNVLYHRQLSIGSQYPPFNSTAKPPITLAFCDGCLSGNDNAFAEGFLWPYANYYGGWCEDQSQLGWSISKWSHCTLDCQVVFWNALKEGYTVHQARLELFDRFVEWEDENIPDVQQVNPTNPVGLVHIYGDYYTRLHGVYSESSLLTSELRWWRTL